MIYTTYWGQSHSDCKSVSSFKSLMQLNHVIEIHKPTQFPFTTVLQILEKKIAIPPFYQGTDNPFHLTFNCRTRNRSKPLTNIVLHTTGKTNGQHCHAIIRIGKFSSICRIIYDISQKKFDTQTVIQPSKTVTYNPQENLLRVTNKPTNLFCS